jgi:hypothetical protein
MHRSRSRRGGSSVATSPPINNPDDLDNRGVGSARPDEALNAPVCVRQPAASLASTQVQAETEGPPLTAFIRVPFPHERPSRPAAIH